MDIKTKIYLTLVVWIAVSAAMYFYGFGILQGSNRDALAAISQEKDTLLNLQAEQQSYRLAQKDLDDLAKKDVQPEDFFSEDVTLVKEISTLENLGKASQVKLDMNGISGTIDVLPKAKTQSDLYTIPYTMSITGELNNVIDFVEALYNQSFITSINSFSMGAATKEAVSVNLTATLYVRK